MEKFMQRENGDLCAHPIASPKLPNPMLEDMNFSDVFGGPPRRLSIKDVKVKYSFGETESEEETVPARWSSLGEKPVFGEEILPRRQHHEGGDFFDDIFRGDESYNSPRRTDIRDRDSSVFRSNPGSRILSPAWPLPPKADPFGISAPTQFSLPAKLTKGLETPRITSHVQHVMDGSSTNGLTSPHSPSLSRFSSPVSRSQDEYRHSPLSHEVPSISKDSPPTVSDQKENGENSSFGKIFHFSIYKWAGREVPMLLPLVGRNNIGALDGNKYERSASSNERIESRSSTPPKRQSMLAREEEKISMEYKEVNETSEPKSQSQISANDVAKTKEGSSRSKTKPLLSFLRDISDAQRRNSDKEVVPKKKESLQSKQKPLQAFLGEQQGVVLEIKQSKKKILNGIHRNSHEAKTPKKNVGTRTSSNDGSVGKSDLQPPGVASGENRVRGMVREYVQIFNQEADSRPRVDLERSRWKADEKESAEMPEASIKADDDLKKDEAQRCSPAKNGFLSEKPHRDSMTFGENADDFSEDDFLVQELSEDHEIITESEDPDPNDTKAIDSKIRQWAFGKKGNIRSLLSTLQFVLWPESGWKPVPLVELIESNAVKRAYQKALLRLHPDKLQQKGAVFHQKYIAEKVFDILQEAWDQFNVLVPI